MLSRYLASSSRYRFVLLGLTIPTVKGAVSPGCHNRRGASCRSGVPDRRLQVVLRGRVDLARAAPFVVAAGAIIIHRVPNATSWTVGLRNVLAAMVISSDEEVLTQSQTQT
jgi:hypothetical protein